MAFPSLSKTILPGFTQDFSHSIQSRLKSSSPMLETISSIFTASRNATGLKVSSQGAFQTTVCINQATPCTIQVGFPRKMIQYYK